MEVEGCEGEEEEEGRGGEDAPHCGLKKAQSLLVREEEKWRTDYEKPTERPWGSGTHAMSYKSAGMVECGNVDFIRRQRDETC